MQASHVYRESTALAESVLSMDTDATTVTIDWMDGNTSTFHNVWLRDNCSCDQCGNHSGGSRFLELRDMSRNLAVTAEN